MMMDKMLDAVVIETDGVEHARGCLDRSRGRVAGARLARDRFGDDAAKELEIDDLGHFAGVAKRARCNQNGIAQIQAAQGDRKIGHRECSVEPKCPARQSELLECEKGARQTSLILLSSRTSVLPE